jgi:hypothetical protein
MLPVLPLLPRLCTLVLVSSLLWLLNLVLLPLGKLLCCLLPVGILHPMLLDSSSFLQLLLLVLELVLLAVLVLLLLLLLLLLLQLLVAMAAVMMITVLLPLHLSFLCPMHSLMHSMLLLLLLLLLLWQCCLPLILTVVGSVSIRALPAAIPLSSCFTQQEAHRLNMAPLDC